MAFTVKDFLAAGRKRKPGTYTATQTRARELAERRAAKNPSVSDVAEESEKEPTMKGVGGQPNAGMEDIEGMISGKQKKNRAKVAAIRAGMKAGY